MTLSRFTACAFAVLVGALAYSPLSRADDPNPFCPFTPNGAAFYGRRAVAELGGTAKSAGERLEDLSHFGRAEACPWLTLLRERVSSAGRTIDDLETCGYVTKETLARVREAESFGTERFQWLVFGAYCAERSGNPSPEGNDRLLRNVKGADLDFSALAEAVRRDHWESNPATRALYPRSSPEVRPSPNP